MEIWFLFGLVAWCFGVWWGRLNLFGGFDWTYWLMIVPCLIAGPFAFLPFVIDKRPDR